MLTRFLPRCLPRCLPSLAARQLSTTPRDFNRQLAGKTAIVTGAAGGIGRGVAELFAEQGANVVVADYNKDAATQVANGLATPSIASFVDVTSEEAVKECMSSAIAEFGQVDILVANAGHQFISPIDEFPLAEWRRMISVHLDGTFLFTREALRHFYAEKVPGKIIMMGSVHSKEASVLKSAYVAAKHAIMGFARAAAKEAGPAGVSVNVVCPGFVLTPLVEKQIPEQAENLGMSEEEVVKNVMLVNTVDKEFATISDVAEACLFLAGHPTNALTGQSITVSHGWNMS